MRFLPAVLLMFLVSCAGPHAAPEEIVETPESLIRTLYDNHRPQFEQGLDLADRAVLTRYFSPALTELFVREAACRERTKEVCNLDFDPIFAAQDFDRQQVDLSIEQLSPRRFQVTYTNMERRTQIYEVLPGSDGVRIDDIVYPEAGSLKALLSAK